LAVGLIVLHLGVPSWGQQAFVAPTSQGNTNGSSGTAIAIRPDYLLGPNDQILVRVPQEEQINERPFRIDPEGFVTLPVAGRVRAEGLTVQALEAAISGRLREYIRDPLVSITVVQFRSEPVFFLGAFRNPGIYPLQGRRTLVEMLAAAGGIQANASRRLKVTRRSEYGPIPLSTAIEDPERKISTVEISLQSLTESINSSEDLILQAYDVVSIDRSERVYVTGEVTKVSAIELGERSSISVAQAITEAGGFTTTAVRGKARVLRPVLGTSRRAEFTIDLKRIFEGKDIDFPLLPNDVLYVSRASAKAFLIPVAATMIGSLPYLITTIAIR
jgi:polysaccharide export outer membrane protein